MIKFITYKGLKEWGLALVLALILALIVKGFVLQSYIVDSPRMEKTILEGDYIMVNKLIYGARLPISVLSLPFFPSVYSSKIELSPLRIPAFGSVKVNDILVFNNPSELKKPIDKRQVNVKRCVALPGAKIELNDKVLYVNDRIFNEPENLQYNYRLVGKNKDLPIELFKRYGITQGGVVSDIGIFEYAVKYTEVDELKKESAFRYIRELKDFPGENSEAIFPEGASNQFSKDFFGPLVIPYKGQEIRLDIKTYPYYKLLVEEYEHNNVEIINNAFVVNGIATANYVVKNDYYFVLDDNRDNANDSRYWGFLPKNHIIGKAWFTWLSKNNKTNKYRWERSFSKIQ